MGFQAPQHLMSVPRCLFLLARNAAETIKNFAPMLSSVFRESSRIVCFLALFKNSSELRKCAKWFGRKSVVIVEPLQNRTKDRMFGHPAWNAFALLLPISRLLNDKTNRRVVSRNGPVHQVLEDMGVAVKISGLSHR